MKFIFYSTMLATALILYSCDKEYYESPDNSLSQQTETIELFEPQNTYQTKNTGRYFYDDGEDLYGCFQGNGSCGLTVLVIASVADIVNDMEEQYALGNYSAMIDILDDNINLLDDYIDRGNLDDASSGQLQLKIRGQVSESSTSFFVFHRNGVNTSVQPIDLQ